MIKKQLKTLADIDIEGKVVLYRAPYDIDVVDGKLEDTKRIDFTIPTLKFLIEKNCKIVILTYVGRPDGKVVERLKTDPHAKYLSKVLNINVKKVDDCVGQIAEDAVFQMKSGQVLMLENVRFYNQEVKDDDEFAKELCKGKDIVVFDAFPQAHRKHASTTGILRHLNAVAGLYFEKEYTQITNIISNTTRPFVAVIGGAKVSDKVLAIKNLAHLADLVLVGGGVANAFLYQQGFNISKSFVENVFVDEAVNKKQDIKSLVSDILRDKTSNSFVIANKICGIENSNIILPVDFVVEINGNAKVIDIEILKNEKDFEIKDIGPKTITMYTNILTKANTVFWNGPVGVFEQKDFSLGSVGILNFIKNFKGLGLVAGGDTIEIIDKFDEISNFNNISLAGGATLDMISGKQLAVMPFLTR